jgi:hypothetical protein
MRGSWRWCGAVFGVALLTGLRPTTVMADLGIGIPLFQFFAFYAGDLEVSPGANLRVHGRVHANGDIYLDSSATFWLEDDPVNGITRMRRSRRLRARTGQYRFRLPPCRQRMRPRRNV